MNKFKLIISYDGTDYYGWQTQKELPSIASTLKKTFKNIFGSDITLKGASRTDAGVHALGQVAMFKTELDVTAEKLLYAWNNALPQDIVIRSVEQVAEDFNVYEHIDHKIYYYHFFTERPLPFFARYGLYYYYPIDFKKLEMALEQFVGTHDFRSYCSIEDTREDTVRTIDRIYLEYYKKYGAYRIVVIGHSFLRHMIRRIVGACLEVASKPAVPISLLQEVLEKKDPRQPFPNARAKGLMLYKINYKQKDNNGI